MRFPQLNFADPGAGLDDAQMLRFEQQVAASLDEVFAFFSDPANLQALTPPWLHFQIVETPPALAAGALIRYRLRLHGVPIDWCTRIEQWQPQVRFVDIQLAGPYRLWHHTHEFEALPDGGTLVRDVVHFKVPFGPLGELARRALVQPDTEKIFDYRFAEIARRFG
ncbi:MAG: SRPBCC family protein [Solirubrobacterales bacterium]